MNIRPTIALAAALTITGSVLLPNLLSSFFAPQPSPQSAHTAPENLTEAQQWQANLSTLRSIPAPEATCRVAEWDEAKDGTSGSISFYRGASTTVRFTALPDYVFAVADTDLTADNYRAPSNSEGFIPLSTTCVANIATETTVENYGGNLNLLTPDWNAARIEAAKYGEGFSITTEGTIAPRFEFRFYDASATAADVLLKEALSDIYFARNLSDIGQGMKEAEKRDTALAAGEVTGEFVTDPLSLRSTVVDAFGVSSFEGLAPSGVTPTDETYAALNAYANELIYDYYGN